MTVGYAYLWISSYFSQTLKSPCLSQWEITFYLTFIFDPVVWHRLPFIRRYWPYNIAYYWSVQYIGTFYSLVCGTIVNKCDFVYFEYYCMLYADMQSESCSIYIKLLSIYTSHHDVTMNINKSLGFSVTQILVHCNNYYFSEVIT